jgi:hypothetical protein
MNDLAPKRFDQILKKAEQDDTQVLFSGLIILVVGIVVAVHTFPTDADEGFFGWGWKAVLFFGAMGLLLRHAWKTGRFALSKDYKAAGAFMVEALKGPARAELPFSSLWRMREIAWAEHLDQRRAARPAGLPAGVVGITLMDASGEAIFENTRVACAGCGKALKSTLTSELWKEREQGTKPVGLAESLNAARRCAACGSPRGVFSGALAGPVKEGS